VQTLKKLKQQIQRVQPNWKMNQVVLLHDNAGLHYGGNSNNGVDSSFSSLLLS
jgi:hypothetical protein